MPCYAGARLIFTVIRRSKINRPLLNRLKNRSRIQELTVQQIIDLKRNLAVWPDDIQINVLKTRFNINHQKIHEVRQMIDSFNADEYIKAS